MVVKIRRKITDAQQPIRICNDATEIAGRIHGRVFVVHRPLTVFAKQGRFVLLWISA